MYIDTSYATTEFNRTWKLCFVLIFLHPEEEFYEFKLWYVYKVWLANGLYMEGPLSNNSDPRVKNGKISFFSKIW